MKKIANEKLKTYEYIFVIFNTQNTQNTINQLKYYAASNSSNQKKTFKFGMKL